jgi:hypothetical protein
MKGHRHKCSKCRQFKVCGCGFPKRKGWICIDCQLELDRTTAGAFKAGWASIKKGRFQ